jgi:aspartate oxidase
MESVKQAANYVTESVKGTGATASKEANKEVAKDNNAGIGTRYVATRALRASFRE